MGKEIRRGLIRLWIAGTPLWALYWTYRYNHAESIWTATRTAGEIVSARDMMEAATLLGFGVPIFAPMLLLLAAWVPNGFRPRTMARMGNRVVTSIGRLHG